eukprot:952085_1
MTIISKENTNLESWTCSTPALNATYHNFSSFRHVVRRFCPKTFDRGDLPYRNCVEIFWQNIKTEEQQFEMTPLIRSRDVNPMRITNRLPSSTSKTYLTSSTKTFTISIT